MDKSSEISNFFMNKIRIDNITIVDCENKEKLVNSIKKIEYGIFMDSGPLHVAKLFNKRGILIQSSVSSKILLNKYNKIISVNNLFSSPYCKSPCGLTDLFSYNSRSGCYNSLKVNFMEIANKNLFPFVNRRGIKNNYNIFLDKPVGCLQSLSVQNILNYISKDLLL